MEAIKRKIISAYSGQELRAKFIADKVHPTIPDNILLTAIGPELDEIMDIINNPSIKQNLISIAEILSTDRNGDNNIDIRDIELLATDYLSIFSLIGSIISMLFTISHIKYSPDTTELLLYKLVVYILLHIVPLIRKKQWSKNEVVRILDASDMIYNLAIKSNMIKEFIDKIHKAIKRKGCCCTKPVDHTNTIATEYNDNMNALKSNVLKIKDKEHTHNN